MCVCVCVEGGEELESCLKVCEAKRSPKKAEETGI